MTTRKHPKAMEPSYGQFNLCSTEKEWQYGLLMPDDYNGQKCVSMCVPEEKWLGRYGTDSDDPIEIVDELDAQMRSYWIMTDGPAIKAAIQWVRDNEQTWRPLWLSAKAEELDLRAKRLEDEVLTLRKSSSRLREEAEQTTNTAEGASDGN